jgi:hypothetical protein
MQSTDKSKQVYDKPELVVYGSIELLTAATGEVSTIDGTRTGTK